MEFKEPALLTDEEIAEVLKQADELSKWAADVYAYAQDQVIVHHKQWNGFKLVMGKSKTGNIPRKKRWLPQKGRRLHRYL